MEKLSKTGGWCYNWIKTGILEHLPAVKNVIANEEKPLEDRDGNHQCRKKNLTSCDLEASQKIFSIIESIILWENSFNSLFVVAVFNILFWGIVTLEIRGFTAASSAALVVVLCYSTLESQVEKVQLNKSRSDSTLSTPQAEWIGKIIIIAKSGFENTLLLRKNQPGVFCIGICTASVCLWCIGAAVNGVLLTYTICMGILLGPVLFMKIPRKIFTSKAEWENEIDEFLPVVTEDSLQLLNRAGETGDHSPTPPSGESSDNHIDPFNDDELIGLKMPSHEDGSTDGLELSELELSGGETDVDGLKIQSRHFERESSSSEDEEDLKLKSKVLFSDSDEHSDESEFEVIDSHEINNSNNPKNI